MRFNAVRSLLDNAHLETRRGTHEQAKIYCTKEESRVLGPFDFGDAPAPGRRTDLERAKELLDNGASLLDVSGECFGTYLRYHVGIEKYRNMRHPIRNSKTRVEVHWGVAGAGKTYGVYDNHGVENVFNMPRPNGNRTIWFDGYRPETHKVLLIDDFYGWAPLNFMLQLLDAYPFQVQVKGGFIQFSCETIWITSNSDWETWYDWDSFNNPELKVAFRRRIDYIKHYSHRHNEINLV